MALQEFEEALEATNEVEITVTGRKSGREISMPVWFVKDREDLYLLPMSGSHSDWYNNLLKTPAIALAAGGAQWNAKATPLTAGAEVDAVKERFRGKYGADQVKQYYGNTDVAIDIPLT